MLNNLSADKNIESWDTLIRGDIYDTSKKLLYYYYYLKNWYLEASLF